jgi:hypothetical protein
MHIIPITQRAAKKFIDQHHRHHKAPVGSIFQIGLVKDCDLVGVIMVGRPVARSLDDGLTAEVNRNCVIEGVKNGTSMLLGAAARAARELGYLYIITYTLDFEGGASLRAVGWKRDSEHTSNNGWNNRKNRQIDMFPNTKKIRWVKKLNNKKSNMSIRSL